MPRLGARLLFLPFLLSVAGAAVATPHSIADCATIANAFSYNACLASFGPTQKGGGSSEAAAGSYSPTPAPAAAPRPVVTHRSNGRVHAEFTVGRRGHGYYSRRRYRRR